MIFQGLAIKEAIASVALSHDPGCDCRVCRAAAGDLKAFAEVWNETTGELERRQAGGTQGEGPVRADTRTGPGSGVGSGRNDAGAAEATDGEDRTEE